MSCGILATKREELGKMLRTAGGTAMLRADFIPCSLIRHLESVCVCLLGLACGAVCQQAEPPIPPIPSMAESFQAAHFERFAGEGARQDISLHVQAYTHGLSAHQRMVTHLEMDIPGAELVKRVADGELLMLVEVKDSAGHSYRDSGFVDLRPITPDLHKKTWVSTWEAFALPGDYRVSFLLYDGKSGEHSFAQKDLHVSEIKHDSFADIWQGIPDWEFWAPLKDVRDNIYRPDIESKLHLALATKRRMQIDVLADLTPSGLFHGSGRFYSRFLAVALPLVRDLSEIHVNNGSLNVATLDLRQRRITFEQDDVTNLNWTALKEALAPENGPGMIDLKGLEQAREQPDFLRDQILRRMGTSSEEDVASPDGPAPSGPMVNVSGPCAGCSPAIKPEGPGKNHPSDLPFHVFIVVGSPMDFYAFHHFPPIDPAQAENCVVYYLQYQVYGPYATGAMDKVSKMLKPVTIHTIKVRSGESIREALKRIVAEVGQIQ
ncbi:MAG TPA: hypothetical protein VJV96_08680 [Candidatus Angelobacter sp.]|nr:hypothetical protein [Candidatus Angelobacter sp.]